MIYKEFEKILRSCKAKTFSIGKSTLGKDVLACHIGKENGKQILVQAGIHAREYITSLLALNQANKLFDKDLEYGVYFVLCTNPDGVEVVLDGFSALRENERNFCEKRFFDHKLFKANANLVDLNTNFDALWGQGKSNLTTPNFESYVGKEAESEIETKNLVRFTRIVKPKLTLSYHTKGEVIYFGFDTQSEKSLERDKKIGEKLSKTLNFPLERSFYSCGGYKDWACGKLDIPSFTIEFGKDSLSHPIGEEHLEELDNQSKDLFDVIGDVLADLS